MEGVFRLQQRLRLSVRLGGPMKLWIGIGALTAAMMCNGLAQTTPQTPGSGGTIAPAASASAGSAAAPAAAQPPGRGATINAATGAIVAGTVATNAVNPRPV